MTNRGPTLLKQIVPPGVVVVETGIEHASVASLFPEERAAVDQAVSQRQVEFAAGRLCARKALGILGVHPCPIRVGSHREPDWPEGIAGSITHSQSRCAAAVCWRDVTGSIGIDIQAHEPLPQNVGRLVCTPSERAWIERQVPRTVCWETLLFSVKESVFKAWFPVAGTWLDFHDAAVSVDVTRATCSIVILPPAGDLAPAQWRMRASYAVSDEYLVTCVVLSDSSGDG